MLVEAIDTRSASEAPDAGDLDRWADLARSVLAGMGFDQPVEMGLRMVGRREMAQLNRAHMGHTGPTDVLSFPVDGDPRTDAAGPGSGPGADGAPAVLGDVVLCPAVAAEHAAERSVPVDDELALLVVHGILHLLFIAGPLPLQVNIADAVFAHQLWNDRFRRCMCDYQCDI